MMQPKCKDCESTDVEWRQTMKGKWALYDTKPRIHAASCTKRPKRSAKAPTVAFSPNTSLEDQDRLNALIASQLKEAK